MLTEGSNPTSIYFMQTHSPPTQTALTLFQVHHVTRQIEYHGELMSLTEAIVGFPVGGQVLISGSTYQRIYGRLHTIGPLHPISPAQGRSALGRSRSRRLSHQPKEGWKGKFSVQLLLLSVPAVCAS